MSEEKRVKVKGHYRVITRDDKGRIVSSKKWSPNKKPRWDNCCYHDTVKLCIHPSIMDTVVICEPDICDYYFSYEQAEEYVK